LGGGKVGNWWIFLFHFCLFFVETLRATSLRRPVVLDNLKFAGRYNIENATNGIFQTLFFIDIFTSFLLIF